MEAADDHISDIHIYIVNTFALDDNITMEAFVLYKCR